MNEHQYRPEEVTDLNRKQKLVRDNDLELMAQQGVKYKHRIATPEEYREYLFLKLVEEAQEHAAKKKPEELADILELVYACARMYGLSMEEIERIRKAKRDFRGGFEKGIVLTEWEQQ